MVKVAPQGDLPVPSWPQPRSQTATLKFSHFELKDQSSGKNESCKYWVKLCSFAKRKLHLEETSRFNYNIQNAKRKNAITGKAPKCLSTLQLLTSIKFGISSPNMTERNRLFVSFWWHIWWHSILEKSIQLKGFAWQLFSQILGVLGLSGSACHYITDMGHYPHGLTCASTCRFICHTSEV